MGGDSGLLALTSNKRFKVELGAVRYHEAMIDA